MVSNKSLLVLLLAALTCSSCAASGPGQQQEESEEARLHRRTERPPPEFHPEEPCSRAGGICLASDECPIGQLAEPNGGLCPKQRALGAECCHGLSTREQKCARRGGECMAAADCGRNRLRDDVATDCKLGESCCILVAL